jgi:hypothetical protein
MATITEDLVLLLFDPESGRAVVDSTSLDRAIGGALLLDLSTRDRLTAHGAGAKARLSVGDSSATREPLLDAALARLDGRNPLRAQKAVERLARKTREPVLQRLVERGLLRRDRGRLLGIIPVTTWPAGDAGPVTELRARVAAVLRDRAAPDQHLALMIPLLHAVKAEHKLVEGPRRQLRARAEEVAQGDWAGPAVRKAVQAVQTSVAVAVAASASAAGSAGGSWRNRAHLGDRGRYPAQRVRPQHPRPGHVRVPLDDQLLYRVRGWAPCHRRCVPRQAPTSGAGGR